MQSVICIFNHQCLQYDKQNEVIIHLYIWPCTYFYVNGRQLLSLCNIVLSDRYNCMF